MAHGIDNVLSDHFQTSHKGTFDTITKEAYLI